MNFKENVSFKKLTTFKIGGPAKYYVEVSSEEELKESVDFAKERKLNIFILGGGSDILVSDRGFDGLVIKYKDDSIKFEESSSSGKVHVTVGAGTVWDDLVRLTVDKELGGIECMSGIYGSVGAAPIQNIGAYGQELKDSFVSLNAYEISSKKFVKFDKAACKFAYRDSVFKSKAYWQKYVIINICLELSTNVKPIIKYESLANYLLDKNISDPSLKEVRSAVLAIRSGKFENPEEVGNAGSYFKNPILQKADFESLRKKFQEVPFIENPDGTYKTFAGWYIENVGFKGKRIGDAQVSDKHALILLNSTGKATAEEIKSLEKEIIKVVLDKYNVKLEPEVQHIA